MLVGPPGTVRGVAGYFARIEPVHIHMDVDHVGSFGEALHRAVKVCGSGANVFQSELLNLGAIEEFLFERVRVAHAHFDDVARRQRRLQAGF